MMSSGIPRYFRHAASVLAANCAWSSLGATVSVPRFSKGLRNNNLVKFFSYAEQWSSSILRESWPV